MYVCIHVHTHNNMIMIMTMTTTLAHHHIISFGVCIIIMQGTGGAKRKYNLSCALKYVIVRHSLSYITIHTHTHTHNTHIQTHLHIFICANGYTNTHKHMQDQNLPLSPSHANTFKTCSRLVLASLASGAICRSSKRIRSSNAINAGENCTGAHSIRELPRAAVGADGRSIAC
jgi:hypothetical protein